MENFSGHIRNVGKGEVEVYKPGDEIHPETLANCKCLTCYNRVKYSMFMLDNEVYYYKSSGSYSLLSDNEIKVIYITQRA